MKTFSVTFNCGNEAFEPMPAIEIARVLADTARLVSTRWQNETEFSFRIFDLNGNSIGDATLHNSQPWDGRKS